MSLPQGFAFEGKGDDKRIVATTAAPDRFFDDPQEPQDIEQSATELARKLETQFINTMGSLYNVVRLGPKRKWVMRLVLAFRDLKVEKRSLREIAAELGCSVGSLCQEAKVVSRQMNIIYQSRKAGK